MYSVHKFFLLVILIGLCSCAQLSLFQDGRTIGKGNTEIGATASLYGFDEDLLDEDISSIIVPGAIVYVNRGVHEDLDLQFSVSSALNMLLGMKYQLVGSKTSKFATAINPGYSIQYGGVNETFPVSRLHLAFVSSFHPNEKTSVFFEPRYIYQFEKDNDNNAYPGGTIGLNFRPNTKIRLGFGFSAFSPTSSRGLLYQVGLGAAFMINTK